MNDEEKPREDTRFKSGKSGNPRGRPRKAVRSDVPGQILEDVRSAAQTVYPSKHNPDGLPAGQLIARNLVLGAMMGKPTALRMYFELMREALANNVAKDPILYLLEGTDPMLASLDEMQRANLYQYLAKRSLKPRRMR